MDDILTDKDLSKMISDNKGAGAEELTPVEYFNGVKNAVQTMTTSSLTSFVNNCVLYANKYLRTGQLAALEKIKFYLQNAEKEHQLLDLDISLFVDREDIEEYIEKVSSKVIKIQELEAYEREIPDELVEKVEQTKGIFDVFYVVFTDYTGKVEKKVERERRSKDPILFGTFKDDASRLMANRFYYLGDWEDEYCDLTLDKMARESKTKLNKSIVQGITKDLDEIKQEISRLKRDPSNRRLHLEAKGKNTVKSGSKVFKKLLKTFSLKINKK